MQRAIVLAAAILALASPADAQAVKSFKTWNAICDNLKTCTAFGYTDEGADAAAFIRLARAAGPAAAPKITLRAETEDGDDGSRPLAWRVAIDGAIPAGLRNVVTKGSDGERRAELSPVQAAALLAALRNGAQLSLLGGKAPIAMSLAGSSAALLWIDDQQGRVGTVTALAAKGAKPASAVPPAPAPPAIHPAAAVSQTGLPAKPPGPILANPEMKTCDDPGARGDDFTIARLGPGQVLWGAPCSAGAYNFSQMLFVADEAGRGASLIVPPDAEATGSDTDKEVVNVDYDAKARILFSFDKGRGIGDCGASIQWVWDGRAFRLLDETVMPNCLGVIADDWPSLYHAVLAR